MTLASIGVLKNDRSCLTGYWIEEQLAKEAAAAAEAEAARLALEEANRKNAPKQESGGGGSFAAVLIILLLLAWCGVWIYFSDKLCCCYKEKIGELKAKARAKLCKKEKKIMAEAYEFEEISTPKSPSLLRSKNKNSPNDSSRSPLREKRSVRW